MESLTSMSADPESTPLTMLEALPRTESGIESTSGAMTPTDHTTPASPTVPFPVGEDGPDETTKYVPLSRKKIIGIAVVFLLSTIAFAVASGLVQSNRQGLTRSHSDLFDPGCVDKLGDSQSPGMSQTFDLDLTFGNFTFTHAKIIDVAWDTTIGQGGRLLHGWILYRCVMRRLLIHVMEHYCVSVKYYLTISWSRASFESLWVILKDWFIMQGFVSFFCTLLLIYALSYTLLFSLLWSAATGYLSLSHRLYAMPDGSIIPLNTPDLTLCWVLDGSRLDSAEDHIEIGPDFSALGSLTTSSDYSGTKPCLNVSYIGDTKVTDFHTHRLAYTSGGWKVDSTTTIWDHFGLQNGTNNIQQSSENFQSIRGYAITRQLLQISFNPQEWLAHGPEAALSAEMVDQDDTRLDWWAGTNGTCTFRNLTSSRPILRSSLNAAQMVPPQNRPDAAYSPLKLKFDGPEIMSAAYFSLGNLSGESLPPGLMPYNSTLWLNGSAISLDPPFIDFGHDCSGNNGFGSLGNCICYKGQPISLDLLGEERAICNTAPGYVWGFSSYLVQVGLALEATYMACCLVCYLWLSLRSGLVGKKAMRNAGPMKFALEFSEAVYDVEQAAAELSESRLQAKLQGINVGYRLPSAPGKHEGLRHRVVAGLEREEREIDVMDRGIREVEAEVNDWVENTWRRPKPTNREVYEDLNWRIYER